MRPYARVLATPGAAVPLLAGFVGALPIGMLGLSVLILVRSTTGSLGAAGVVAGLLTAGNAVSLAVQGQLIDRRGQTVVLVPAGLMCAASLTLLTATATWHGPLPVVAALALVGGAALPATTSSMRVLWPLLVPDSTLRVTAYALVTVMFTVSTISGPLIVSALVVAGGAATPVLVAAGLAGGSAVLFASARASRHWQPAIASRDWRPRVVATPGMRTLLVGALASGPVIGLVNVAVPAVTFAHHVPAFAGVLFAVASAGDLVGGLVYGGRQWRMAPHWRLPVCQTGSAVIVACMAIAGEPLWLLPLMLAMGLLNAPVSITTSILLDSVAAPGALTEAYTVLVGVYLLGSSVGYAAGGTLARAVGSPTVFAVAGGTMAVVAIWTLARRRTLRVMDRNSQRAQTEG